MARLEPHVQFRGTADHRFSGRSASFWDIVGFAGSTISTMGLGRQTPGTAVWHVVSVLSSISGMVVLTLSMTFVLNVTSVATNSRGMAAQLDRMRRSMDGLADVESEAVVLAYDASIVSNGSVLGKQRASFPLASNFDPEGSQNDIRRAATDFLERLEPLTSRADGSTAARIAVLSQTLRCLSESDI